MAPFLFIGLTGSTERSEKRLINEDNGRTGPASHSLSRYRVEIGGRRLVHLSAKKNLLPKKFYFKMSFWFFLFSFYWNAVLGEKINTSFVCWAKLIPLWGCIVMQGVLLYSVLKSSRTSCLQFYCPPHSSLMLCNLVCKLAEPNKVKQHLLHSTLRRNHSCSVSCMEPQTTWQVFLSAPQSQLRGKCWGKLLLGDRESRFGPRFI